MKCEIMNKIIETKIAIKKAGLLKFKGFMPADFITIISLSFEVLNMKSCILQMYQMVELSKANLEDYMQIK